MSITKLYPIRFDNFRVAGEEMITKPDWQKYYPADGVLTNWALRSVLIVTEHRKVLIDAGFGNKQSEAFFKTFQLNGNFSLTSQLAAINLSGSDITDVLLTHLHFDHCGGCLLRKNNEIIPAFPNASLWLSKIQWESAQNPGAKEADSFLPENINSLPDHYPVNFIEEEGGYMPGIIFKLVHGHTAGQIIPVIHIQNKICLFGADLFPSTAHLEPDVNMSYDINEELATKEKEQILEECALNNYIIIFQHSLYIECCTVKKQHGKVVLDKTFHLESIGI
jgi:glyoxylase-like metal-dependent hydrolase (beta-lactamase superfamily II)